MGVFMSRDDVPSMNHSGYPSQDRQADVNPEVCEETSFEEYRDGRKEDGEQVEEYIPG